MEVDLKILDDSDCTCSKQPGFQEMLKGMANEGMAGMMGKVEGSNLCTSALLDLYANALLLMVHGISINSVPLPPGVVLDALAERCRAMFPTFRETTYLEDVVQIRGGAKRRDQ